MNTPSTVPRTTELHAPSTWSAVDFISDLHLQADQGSTFAAWQSYMENTPADAVFWAEGDGDPLIIRSPHIDAKLLAALLDTTPITGGVA